ncbi:ABC transporter ATP-binding protein [Paenibacillus taichungensis]
MKEPLISTEKVGVIYKSSQKIKDLQNLSYDFLLRRNKDTDKEAWALKNVSFTAYPGDVIGIIGSNGAGKSTLCRVISGLIKPDSGSITLNAKVSALLALGTGFNQELTGRENIILNGMMLGYSHHQIKGLMKQIVEFAELGDFIDQPIKTYSSGMKARLGFSVAVAVESQILILDEVLSVGDKNFRQKANEKIKELVGKAGLVIIVSHSMDYVEKNCNKVLWIDKGELKAFGEPADIVERYKSTVKKIKKAPKNLNLIKTDNIVGFDTVIKAEDIGVKYKLKGSGKDFWALSSISFDALDKEIIGIIGSNGAGKSTLCRVLSNILIPDKGELTLNLRVSALLSLGAGFNTELSGKDNVYLNGLMLGLSKKELDQLYQDIVEFAELEKHMHRQLKHYSSGMRSRLGFSIAAMMKPDILIIDEALNTGDISFYEKASAKIQEIVNRAKAVIVVTHNLRFVETICTRAIWIDKGIVAMDGVPSKVIEHYKG